MNGVQFVMGKMYDDLLSSGLEYRDFGFEPSVARVRKRLEGKHPAEAPCQLASAGDVTAPAIPAS